MKKLVIYILIMSLIQPCLSACSSGDSETGIPDRPILGFSQLGDESEWRTASTSDIKRAAESAGVQLMFENAQQQQFNQIKALRSFILKGVDVIAFCPIVEEGWDLVLGEAKEAEIPIIVVDREIVTESEGLFTAFLGANFHREGVRAGEWMVERFADKDGPIRIAELSGTPESSPTIGRDEGLREVLASNPKFEIVFSKTGDFMRSRGRELMLEILQEAPNIDILYAHNDDMAIGAIEIMEEHGIKPGTDIVIVSVDAQTSGLKALEQGKINCLIECSPYVGDELMELVLKIVNDKPFPAYTYTETRVFTDKDDFSTLPVRPAVNDSE